MFTWIRRLLSQARTRGIAQKQRDELVRLDRWTNVPLGCCDCGLTHRYDFFVDPEGRLCLRARRDLVLTYDLRSVRDFRFQPTGPPPRNEYEDRHPAKMIPMTETETRRLQRFRARIDADPRCG